MAEARTNPTMDAAMSILRDLAAMTIPEDADDRPCDDTWEDAATLWDLIRRAKEALQCEICGQPMTWRHDHQPDLSGLDDGPPLDPPRKKPAPKSSEETKRIRAQAWATRRRKYGEHGHR